MRIDKIYVLMGNSTVPLEAFANEKDAEYRCNEIDRLLDVTQTHGTSRYTSTAEYREYIEDKHLELYEFYTSFSIKELPYIESINHAFNGDN